MSPSQVIDGDCLIGTFCGTVIPDPILSEAREMLLWFITDWSVQRKGFKASYRNLKGLFETMYFNILNVSDETS